MEGNSDLKTAPYPEGHFIGDYQGLGATETERVPFFVQTTGNATDPTDVFVAPSPSLAQPVDRGTLPSEHASAWEKGHATPGLHRSYA
jgi:hypothetical protein